MAKGRLEDSIDGARWIWAAHNRRGLSVSSFFHTSRFLTLKCRVQVLNVQVPLLFKSIVDALNVNVDIMASLTARLLAGSLIIGCTSSSSSYPPLTCSYETYRRSSPTSPSPCLQERRSPSSVRQGAASPPSSAFFSGFTHLPQAGSS